MTRPEGFDALIIGGGIVGSCAGLDLAREGLSVAIVDEGRHTGSNANAGSLHVQMQSRFIRLYPDQVAGVERSLPLYVAATRRWRELEAELAADFEMKLTGGLMVAEDAAQFAFLAEKCAREKALGLDAHMLERAELARLAPYLGEAVLGAEFCAHEGKLNPLSANEAIRRALAGLGVARFDETKVTGLAGRGAGMVATLASPKGASAISAGRVILSAGAGTGALAALLGVRIPTSAEPLHMNVTEATAPLIGHLVQHADRMITLKQLAAGQVVIGGGWPARLEGPEAFPLVEPASLIANLALARHIVPRLGALRVIRAWAGVNTTCDGQCILGPLPGWPMVFAAVPGDAGYTLGPIVGRMAAAIVTGRDAGLDVGRFGVGRFG